MNMHILVKRLLLLASILLINLIVPQQQTGMAIQCIGNQCIYTASSSIAATLMGVLWGVVLFTGRNLEATEQNQDAGFWRRLAAFVIDFWILMAIFTPIFVLPVLLTEFLHTNNFYWNFARDFSRTGDWPLRIALMLGLLATIVKSQAYFIRNNKPSVGQYILGIRIIPVADTNIAEHATKRVLLSVAGLIAWPITLYTAVRGQKVYFWDRMTNTRTVIAAHKN